MCFNLFKTHCIIRQCMQSLSGAKLYSMCTTFWVSTRGVQLHPMRLWNFSCCDLCYARCIVPIWPASHVNQRGVGPRTLHRSIFVLLQRFFGDWDTYSTVLLCYEQVYPTPRADVHVAQACTYSNLLISDTILRRPHCYRKLHQSASDVILRLIPNNFSNNNKSHNLGLHGSNSWAPFGL